MWREILFEINLEIIFGVLEDHILLWMQQDATSGIKKIATVFPIVEG